MDGIRIQFQKKRPNVVVVSHASNVCGIIAPVADIFQMAKQYGAFTVLDMAQTAGVVDLNIQTAQADCVVFAGHKTLYGPFGASGFMKRNDIELKPLLYGGTGIDSANHDMPASGSERYEAGSLNLLAIAGLYAALQWHEKIGIDTIYAREQENKEKLLQVLMRHRNISFFEADDQIGVISCIFDSFASDSIGSILAEQGVEVRTGLHCAPNAHRFLKTFPAGTVRFSISYFTSIHDFAKLEAALQYIDDNS